MSLDDNKRITKNTIFLYFRTFLSLIISLYTSRKILEALGVEDFGILNVVAGVIAMLTFISGSMSVATQRFLTVELGKKDYSGYNKMFNMSVLIHLILAILILIGAETIGLWFVNTHLNIPSERMYAANWIYQATILSTILGVIQTPYHASIISHEHMHIYAYVGLGEVTAKLLVVMALLIYPYDRLVIWGFAFFLLQLCVATVYCGYCSKKFDECRLKFVWDKNIFKAMMGFTGWNMFGTIAWILKDQGANIVMNMFGGPVVNAARGVSYQVSGAIQNLTSGFQNAVNPQLTKRYASDERHSACNLLFQSSKISYFLLFVVALPVFLESSFILKIWLVNVPPMTALFSRIILIEALMCTLSSPMITMLMATGNIKWYQIVVGSVLLLNIPVAYLLLKLGFHIVTPLIVSIIFFMIGHMLRTYFCKKQLNLSIRSYTQNTLLPIITVTLLSVILPFAVHSIMSEGWSRLFVVTLVSTTATLSAVCWVGLTQNERTFMAEFLFPKIKRLIRI